MPFITAMIIDKGLEVGNLPAVYRYGAIMVVMAFLSLFFGAMAGKKCCRSGGRSVGESAGSDLRQYSDFFFFQYR